MIVFLKNNVQSLKHIFLLIALLIGVKGTSQLFDSIQSSLKYKPKPVIKLDSRNAFITNTFIQTNAIKAGLNFNKTFKVGIGYSWLKTSYQQKSLLRPNDSTQLKIHTLLAFAEFAYWTHKNWSSEIIVQISGGNMQHVQNNKIILQTPLFIYEPAMLVDYRFLRYFSIGGGIGYRLAAKFNKQVKERFTSPIYIYRLKVDFGRVYEDLKK